MSLSNGHPWALRLCLLGLALMLATTGDMAWAQDAASREREALRRTQQALRAAQQETAALQQQTQALGAEKSKLLQEKQALDTTARQRARQVAGAQAQARQAQARVLQLESELAAVRAELTAAQERSSAQASELADQARLVATLRTSLERQTLAVKVLEKRNGDLYQVGLDAIELYRSQRPKEALARMEPFFGIGHVTLDNVAERWRDRLETARWQGQEQLAP
ncbi:MAG: hypothetical protein ACK4K3_05975 [Aquabacterium sp.]